MGQPAKLFGAFPPVSDAAWMDQISEDLSHVGARDLGWALPAGPRVEAFYRDGPSLALPDVTPEWTYGDYIHVAAGSAVEAVRDATVGGADFAMLRLTDETTGHALDQLAGEFPVVLHWQAVPERGLPDDFESVFDPVALALTGADPEPAYEVASTASETLSVDLTPWNLFGAPLTWLAAAAFATISERLSRHRGENAHTPSLRILVPVGTSFFPSIALLRAVRAGAGQVCRIYGAGCQPQITAIVSAPSLTSTDLNGNMLRSTTAMMAAALGGADAVIGLPFDHHAGGSARGRRLARNTAHMLREEAHMALVADPGHGAWYVEHLTDSLGEAGWKLFQAWEESGGVVSAMASGQVTDGLASFRSERAAAVEAGDTVIVGINRFQAPEEAQHAS